MKAIELVGAIDKEHRVTADVPVELPVGQVRLIVLLPDEDEAGSRLAHGIAGEWSPESRGHAPGYLHAGRRTAGECGEVIFSSPGFRLAMCLG